MALMLCDAAVALIQQGLSFRSDLVSAIVASLVEAQLEQERGKTLPWWLVQEDQTLSLSAGVGSVALPSGFLREVEDEEPYRSDTATGGVVHIRKVPFDEAKAVYSTYENSNPIVYAIRKTTLEFFPTPAEAMNVTWSYYKADDAPTLGAENVWLANAPYVLIGRAGEIIAEDAKDGQALVKFQRMYARWKPVLEAQIAERAAAAQYFTLGGDH